MGAAVEIAKEVILKEADGLAILADQIDSSFESMLRDMMDCEGKLCIIGMGKSGHVAKKMAATMSSLGTCAISLHPAECMHGDLGMIQKSDLVILISYSGESDEIIRIIPGIKMIGAKIFGITCNEFSTLAKACDRTLIINDISEACHLGLAPSTSTTAVMALGDAFAITAARLKGFTKNDFGVFHPAGSLGKRLTVRVSDIMNPLPAEVLVVDTSLISEAIIALSNSVSDILLVKDDEGRLTGILSCKEIENAIVAEYDIYGTTISDLINRYPWFVDVSAMAIDALKMADELGVETIPIVRNDFPVGLVKRSDILKAGIYL